MKLEETGLAVEDDDEAIRIAENDSVGAVCQTETAFPVECGVPEALR